jgi:release factor glutamine methyltransferase
MLQKAAGYLEQKGIESSRLDAEVLLANLLGLSRLDLYLKFERPISESERIAYRERIARRAGHEPVAYIVGEREFWSLPLRVTPDVLIPRPDTETVVQAVLDRFSGPGKVVDVGTGSGAIALAVASERPHADVLATESSEAALAVARENGDRNELQRVRWFSGDWLAPVAGEAPFDVVVSNPPYVSASEMEELSEDVREFEPRAALTDEGDGLSSYRQLIPQAAEAVRPGGWLILEIGSTQASQVCALVTESGHFDEPQVEQDLGGNDRVVVAKRSES